MPIPMPLFSHAWADTTTRLVIAVAVTIAFGVFARAVRGVDASGAMAGCLACFALLAGAGPGAFAVLGMLFALTWLSTRVGYRQKEKLGLAERRKGRNGWQVAANLSVAALCVVAFALIGNRAWLIAAIAALAEAATDTVASEIGQASRQQPRLITTWGRVQAGVDGGITLAGTLAGMAAGILIVLVASASAILTRNELWIPAAAGFFGMIADSFLGATLQRRRWISNQGVNLLATLVAAALGYLSSL